MSPYVAILGLAGVLTIVSYFVPALPLHLPVALIVAALLFAK
jgi:hypothetical protein